MPHLLLRKTVQKQKRQDKSKQLISKFIHISDFIYHYADLIVRVRSMFNTNLVPK